MHSSSSSSKSSSFSFNSEQRTDPLGLLQTLYGANFFDFDTAANQLVLGNNVWILFLSWAALSALTMGAFVVVLRRNRAKAKQDEHRDVESVKCESKI